MKEYIDKANELLDLLQKYKSDAGEPLQPVFFHQLHYAAGFFFVNPDKVPESDSSKIGQLAEWLQAKANDLRLQVQHWLIRMDPIFRQMTDIGEQASRSMVSMMAISDLFVKNRLTLLK